MPEPSIPVRFVPPFFADDLRRYVPREHWRSLMNDVVDRLGAFPRLGVELEAPNQGFRCHTMGDWQVYYEVLSDAEGEPVGIEVYRAIPEKYSRIDVFGP